MSEGGRRGTGGWRRSQGGVEHGWRGARGVQNEGLRRGRGSFKVRVEEDLDRDAWMKRGGRGGGG